MRSLKLLCLLVLLGCGAATGTATPAPVNEVPPPSDNSEIHAAITGVNLSDYCPSLEPAPAEAMADMGTTGDMGRFSVPSGTRDMNDCYLTITVTGSAGDRVNLRRVKLFDLNGQPLGALDVSDARYWNGEQFVAWDGTLTSGEPLELNYRLHGIDWNSIPNSYSRTYKVGLTVEVGDAERALLSGESTRQAMVVT
ncbi:MAG: hypothetical protein AAGF12_29195 [Myxococcota bacterium]